MNIAPLRHMQFVLRELASLDEVAALQGCEEVSRDLAEAIFEEAGKFASGVPSPINASGDREGALARPGAAAANYARAPGRQVLFRRVGAARPRVLAETLALDLILELLAHGGALAVLPQHLTRRLAVAGQVRGLDIDTPRLVMPVSVFTLVGAPLAPAADTFRNCFVEAAAQR